MTNITLHKYAHFQIRKKKVQLWSAKYYLVNIVIWSLSWLTLVKLSNGKTFEVYLRNHLKTAIFNYLNINSKSNLQLWLNSSSFMCYTRMHMNLSFWNAFALKTEMIVKMCFSASYKLNFLFSGWEISLTFS